jgi:hypothetical protein
VDLFADGGEGQTNTELDWFLDRFMAPKRSAVMSEKERRQIAAALLQGLLANPGGPVQGNPSSETWYENCTQEQVATWAVDQADALIRELDRRRGD